MQELFFSSDSPYSARSPDDGDETRKFDGHRMGAAFSFSLMLLIVGIPLWWKTTEVHRATLPYHLIHSLDSSDATIGTTIWLASPRFHKIAAAFVPSPVLTKKRVFLIKVVDLNLRLSDPTFETLRAETRAWQPGGIGDISLVEVPRLNGTHKILISNERVIYFTPNADGNTLARIVYDYLLQDDYLFDKIVSLVEPQTGQASRREVWNSLRPSPNYDVIFTIVNADPSRVDFRWNVELDVKKYFQPLLHQVKDVSFHSAKSQWLYLLDFGESPITYDGVRVITHAQLPHIITPLEKKLSSGISKKVHLVLYVVGCSQIPLKFLSEDNGYVDSMISPLWGGIQLLSPSAENCQNGSLLRPDAERVIGLFTSQFHSLLGIHPPEKNDVVQLEKRNNGLLREWELDSLYRSRAVEQLTSASLTLQSLSMLLGKISNIVINEDVASSINLAVDQVYKAKQRLLEGGQLLEALRLSKSAYDSSEQAFSDPTLLALLYFPDDQKYAVYIPLFLPIMIPVMMSLRRIYLWLLA